MYLLSYFTEADEALHLAVSADGRTFTAVNDGHPVLRGEVGTRTLRDPFIGIGPGGLFHLLTTDGWTSDSIVHASSPDLRTWSPQRLLPIMNGVPGARNAWAPEFFTDPATGLYHVIWSSVVDAAHDHAERDWRGSTQDHRIWHAATADFLEFTASDVFFDPGHPVIDATVARTADGFVMAYKDERGDNDLSTAHKNILLTTFTEPRGPFGTPHGPVSPSPVEGPALFQRGGELVLIFDHFLEERYGALATTDLVTWTETELTVPHGARHASVVRLPHDSSARPEYTQTTGSRRQPAHQPPKE